MVGAVAPVEEGGERQFLHYPEIKVRVRKKGKEKITEVLVAGDDYNVTGDYLTSESAGFGSEGNTVDFGFNSKGAALFGAFTGQNTPDGEFTRKLGIILDTKLYSAPALRSRISDRGQITGMANKKEVDATVAVLKAGSLPAALNKNPLSEVLVGPTLGQDTIRQSKVAMFISAILVPLFMLMYYRFAGMVANICLIINMVVLVAVMLAVNAAFTLTGLAGLALAVGMAVDNNVLLYERMREELHRGATIRMAIRNAFHRVGVVIVDANLTHIIAATVLFVLGSDQVKGFAITFLLGAVLSLWTSLFVARWVFEISEKKQWLTKLKMMHVIGDTHIDFMAWFPAALTFSILITIGGLAVAFYRGKGLFDIDFTGGVSIQAVFRDRMDVGDVRKAMENSGLKDKDVAVTNVRDPKHPEHVHDQYLRGEQGGRAKDAAGDVRQEPDDQRGDGVDHRAGDAGQSADGDAGKAQGGDAGENKGGDACETASGRASQSEGRNAGESEGGDAGKAKGGDAGQTKGGDAGQTGREARPERLAAR